MKFKSEIIRCDIPNGNGRVYSKEAIEDALNSPITKERIDSGCFFGYLLDDRVLNNYGDLPMNIASHRLLNYWWEDNVLWGEFETLNTLKDKLLEENLDYNMFCDKKNCMTIYGYGALKPTENGCSVVENFELTNIDFTRNKA